MGVGETALELLRCIETCYLPRLPVDCDADEQQVTAHYRTHGSSLRGRIGALRRRLAEAEVNRFDPESRVQLVTAVLILLHELRSKGPWSPEAFANYAVLIEEAFTGASDVSLERFAHDAGEFRQAIFDVYLAQLHSKLTPTDWKKYPATVEVYCSFLTQIQDYHAQVELNPVKILPAALLLIDDFNSSFKRKGLEVCMAVLNCLDKDDFKTSNYHLVVYDSLVKVIKEKDVEVLRIAFDCAAKLLPAFPPVPWQSTWTKFDELTKNVLEDIYLEGSIERKAACLEFLSKLLDYRKADAARYKNTFNMVICDCLDVCSSDKSRRVLWPPVLTALRTWLKYCWCIWRLDTDKKILSLLLKLLYIQCTEKVSKKKMDELEGLIVGIILLCTKKQQENIQQSLSIGESTIENIMYKERLRHIQKVLTDDSVVAQNKTETTKKGKEKRNRKSN